MRAEYSSPIGVYNQPGPSRLPLGRRRLAFMSHATEPLSADTTPSCSTWLAPARRRRASVSHVPADTPGDPGRAGRVTAAGAAAVADGPVPNRGHARRRCWSAAGRCRVPTWRPSRARGHAARAQRRRAEPHRRADAAGLACVPDAASPSRPPTSAPRAASRAPGRRPAAGRSMCARSTTREVLRERIGGRQSSWEASSRATCEGEHADLDDAMLAALSRSPATRAHGGVRRRHRRAKAARTAGSSTAAGRSRQAAPGAGRRTWRGPTRAARRVLRSIASSVPRMSPELLTGLLEQPRATGASGQPAGIDLAASCARGVDDGIVARFVAGGRWRAIAAPRPASPRRSRRWCPTRSSASRVLDLAQDVAAQEPSARNPKFAELWQQASEMLASYTDEKYISDDYADDLSRRARRPSRSSGSATTRPSGSPRGWRRVSDEQMRRLDQQVLGDLLVVETRPRRLAARCSRWRRRGSSSSCSSATCRRRRSCSTRCCTLPRDPSSPFAGDARGRRRAAGGGRGDDARRCCSSGRPTKPSCRGPHAFACRSGSRWPAGWSTRCWSRTAPAPSAACAKC